MSTPLHQDEPGGWNPALPRPSLANLVHPGMHFSERVAHGTAPAQVMNMRLICKSLV